MERETRSEVEAEPEVHLAKIGSNKISIPTTSILGYSESLPDLRGERDTISLLHAKRNRAERAFLHQTQYTDSVEHTIMPEHSHREHRTAQGLKPRPITEKSRLDALGKMASMEKPTSRREIKQLEAILERVTVSLTKTDTDAQLLGERGKSDQALIKVDVNLLQLILTHRESVTRGSSEFMKTIVSLGVE
jgi:hypothetical protein